MATVSQRRRALAAAGMFVVTLLCCYGVANSSPPSTSDNPEPAKSTTASELGDQIKELQTQLADLKKLAGAPNPRIVAAGTATWTRPREQANNTYTRVKLDPGVTAQLGKDYIVLLTNRSPVGGYPWFDCYWQIASDGFDITLVDPTITGGSQTASYENRNTSYLIDWVVVKK